jgi:hypothetical protein
MTAILSIQPRKTREELPLTLKVLKIALTLKSFGLHMRLSIRNIGEVELHESALDQSAIF